eukprot:10217598-Alexandrium_andersonii.AAC.1
MEVAIVVIALVVFWGVGRQGIARVAGARWRCVWGEGVRLLRGGRLRRGLRRWPVSYTHLTLPTICSV